MDENFPSELSERLTAFDESLAKVDNVMQALHGTPLSQIHEKLSSLDKARLDLLGVYAVNSMFWMYLNCKGENPKEHGVKRELDRVRRYMDRIKEVQQKIEDKARKPNVNRDAAKRFVRNALWQQAHKKPNPEDEPEASNSEVQAASSSTKRRLDTPTNEPKKKTKKKKKHQH